MITEKNASIISAVPGPKSVELLERRKKSVSNGVSYSTPIFAKEAKGALIKDADGNVYVDFAGGIGVINAGHCPDEVVSAIKEQADKYIHTSINVVQYEPYIALAEKLIELAPIRGAKVMFANSGAEAVENAVKIARKYTGKGGVVTVEGSFHGRTHMTMTMTTKVMPYKEGFAPFATDNYKIPCPNVYRNPTSLPPEDFALSCADEFARMLKTNLSPGMIACVVIEPIQGEGGFVPMPKNYLKKMQDICNKNNILLVMDEIQSGVCRTGTFFATEQLDIEPDLMTVSKSIAAGLPISAVIGKEDIMNAPVIGSVGGTFCGNPVACAAALAVIDNAKKYNLSSKAQEIGEYITERLEKMKAKYSVIGDIRGMGAMIAAEFVKDRSSKEPFKEIVGDIISSCLKKGVIFLSAGIYSNCIRFLPPLVMTKEQLEYGLDVLDTAIAECTE